MLGDSNFLLLCTVLQITAKAPKVLVLELQINFIESANNEDQLYLVF